MLCELDILCCNWHGIQRFKQNLCARSICVGVLADVATPGACTRHARKQPNHMPGDSAKSLTLFELTLNIGKHPLNNITSIR